MAGMAYLSGERGCVKYAELSADSLRITFSPVGDPLGEEPNDRARHRLERLTDARQRWLDVGVGGPRVVEPDHRHVVGHPSAGLAHRADHPERHQVGPAHDRGHAPGEQVEPRRRSHPPRPGLEDRQRTFDGMKDEVIKIAGDG
jgi:hypothetical protein